MYMLWGFPATVEYQMIQTSWGDQAKCPADYLGVLIFVYKYNHVYTHTKKLSYLLGYIPLMYDYVKQKL